MILSADWSQIELRMLAHFSHDPALLEAFRAGADLHTATAAAIFGVPAAAVTPSQRAAGKTVNFATIYGQGAAALSQQLSIPHREARHYIDAFFQLYSGVASWRDRVVAEAVLDGSVTTIAGRRRKVPELATRNASERGYGERIAMNTPIQGSVADLCKVAMLRIDRALRDQGLAARMILQIHDELLFEVPDAEIEPVRTVVTQVMETAWSLDVPLIVEVGWGRSWAEAH